MIFSFSFFFFLTLTRLAFCSSGIWCPSAIRRRTTLSCHQLTHSFPGSWLARAFMSVWQTTGEKAAPGTVQAEKLFWNERFKTHLFWVIPTLRETNKNQDSSAVVCWNIWTLFPACDIIFLPDFNVKNSPENPLNPCLLKTQCGLYVCLPLWRNALWHEMCCQSAPLAWQMLRGATN